jgi:GT2 family glycosyltransferase
LAPLVSVVVSTYERSAQLARLLDGLRAQTLQSGRFEVVVVDNGSGPQTAQLLASAALRGGPALRVVRHERTRGPAGGRNSGWRAATAPLIAFIDDDCVPTPGWLAALLKAASEHPGAIVQGATLPEPGRLPVSTLGWHTVRIERASGSYETCNILYPRALLAHLGGFDERFPLRPTGEDTELAWRALEAGAAAVFAPAALVHHEVSWRGYGALLTDAGRWGECARLFALRPGARAILFRGLFWNAWHYLLVRSLVALWLAPPALRRTILLRHALALRARARAHGAGAWAVPLLAAHDALEAAAMLRGSVRHRTLVL